MSSNKNTPFEVGDLSQSFSSLKGKYKNDWIEEAVDIESSGDHDRLSVSHTRNYLGASVSHSQIRILLGIVVLGFIIIIMRVVQLQLILGGYYFNLAEGNRIRLLPIPAERGIIYDSKGKELLRNIPSFSLAVSPQDLPRSTESRDQVIVRLAELSGESVEGIQKILEKFHNYSYESLIIKENLDYDTALKLYLQNSELPGVLVESGSRRRYVSASSSLPMSLSHLLGYLGKLNDQELEKLHDSGYLISDSIGKAGLEKTYENDLRGLYGRKKIEVNAAGKEQNVLAVNPPQPGKNLITSIDLAAQRKMEELVLDTAKATGKKRIAAIAMNPNNGEILAMVSWPSFDNNDFSGGITQDNYKKYIQDKDRPLYNRAIAGTYPPGSTAKLVVAAAALQEKVVTKSTSFLSVGGVELGGKIFKDWRAGGHGITNVIRALAWSVNTYFYYVGGGNDKFVGLGVERLAKYMRAFNMGSITGIDIPGENDGFVPDKDWKKTTKNENWYVGDTYNLSIGQGDLLVTPLQVAVWTAAVANGGNIITPHIGVKLVDATQKIETKLTFSQRPNGLASADNIAIVREGMRECVLSGSCQLLHSLPFSSAGKTGTAQWSQTHLTHAWFTSFAPLQNPQIVVSVLVEEGGEGSTVAMPIAKNFLEWWGKEYLHK